MITRYPAIILATGLLAACATSGTAKPVSQVVAGATLRDAGGAEKGTATLTSDGTRLTLAVTVAGLAAAEHGAHLHTTGRCDAPDFASAGGHLNPHGKQHGMENPQGSHLGDLPNLSIGADGKGSFSVPLNGSPAEIEALLFDADGTALVVHAKPDDYRTDPSGNSGPRIACGVLTRP
ncbi:MAG: superoxide dismutase family protein [Novosphingobium sp.]|nr:superoxide dismutase family protein [Novosphingobium sp.]